MSLRVLYVAKHFSGLNDDEGAIAYALEVLGHTVFRVHEAALFRNPIDLTQEADLCLFHKWSDTKEIAEIAKRIPTVFWFFDRVGADDPTLQYRSTIRKRWMERILPHVKLGFCTDGDAVVNDTTGKLFWLMQGADERVVGLGTPTPLTPSPDILFVGETRYCGQGRESFVREMFERYGVRFFHVRQGVHGRSLANLIISSKIVVAPDAPVSDRYWSNRIYITLGFGGFLFHPYCSELEKQYGNLVEYYKTRDQLHRLVEWGLNLSQEARDKHALDSYEYTLHHHLYRHRVEELLQVVKERI